MAARRYFRALLFWENTPNTQTNYHCTEIELRETSGGSNVASGKTWVASATIGGFPASRLTDGVTIGGNGEIWATQAGPQVSLTIDFGAGNEKEVTRVKVFTANINATSTPQGWLFQSSDDNSTWVDEWFWKPATWTTSSSQEAVKQAEIGGGTARYWSLLLTDNFASSGLDQVVCLGQVSLHNGGSNLLSGGTASALNYFDADSTTYAASNAIDGAAGGTPYASAYGHATGAWWGVDVGSGNGFALPSTLTITSRGDTPDARRHEDPREFRLMRSNDGQNYEIIYYWSDVTDPWSTAGQAVDFDLSGILPSARAARVIWFD